MRRTLLASSVLLALLGLSGCYENLVTAPPAQNQNLTGAGSLSFRLTPEQIRVLGVQEDSLRIEMGRQGFPDRAVSGRVDQAFLVSNLAVGTWSIRVALYGPDGQIRLYGEAEVNIQSGPAVDAVVVLRQATGSVRIRIELDSASVPALDTLEIGSSGTIATWDPVSVRRTKDGIYLGSGLDESCNDPTVAYNRSESWPIGPAARSSYILYLPSDLTLGSAPRSDRPCLGEVSPKTHFVSWTRRGDLVLWTASGPIVVPDSLPPDPLDTSWMRLEPEGRPLSAGARILDVQRTDSGVIALVHLVGGRPLGVSVDSGERTVLRIGVQSSLRILNGEREQMVHLFVPWPACGNLWVEGAAGAADGAGVWSFIAPSCSEAWFPDTQRVERLASPGGPVSGLSIYGASRTDSGVYVLVAYDCNLGGVVMLDSTSGTDAGSWLLYPATFGPHSFVVCSERQHFLFLPVPLSVEVKILDKREGRTWTLAAGDLNAPRVDPPMPVVFRPLRW